MRQQPELGEGELLRDSAAGNAEAVRTLLDSTGPTVYGFVFARVGGDQGVAEDLVQETYMEAMKSGATFRGDAALTTWLCAIARRRLARHYERERRAEVARSGLSLVRDESGAGVDAEADIERRDTIVRALGQLSPLHRQVLVLKYLDDRSVAEIATEVGRTSVSVQSLLQRAREGLRKLMEDTGV